jgi:hypothetical protein
MYAPSEMCERLYRIHPQLRLAWAGRPPAFEGELNPGSFAIIQLYHIQDAGRVGEEVTFRQFWDVDHVINETGDMDTRRIDRGPIFSRTGRVVRDWNTSLRVPIFVATIDDRFVDPVTELKLSTWDVYSGRFLDTMRYWLMPIKDRIKAQVELRNKEIAVAADEVGRDMADFLWWEANKASSRSDTSQARKFHKEERKKFEARQQELDEQARNTYRVPK